MTLTVTKHQENNQNKATSSLLFVKMIAKLEKTPNNADTKPRKQWDTK